MPWAGIYTGFVFEVLIRMPLLRTTSFGVRPAFASRGFTLFELLAVIAIIALLSTIALGGGRYAVEKGKRARCQTELALIATSLESYKREFGDYPHTASAAQLLQALIGRRSPSGVAIDGRCRLSLAQLHTSGGRDPLTDSTAELVDAWDHAYVYAYKTDATWTNPVYVLFSEGPDEKSAAASSDGQIDLLAEVNRDNVWAMP